MCMQNGRIKCLWKGVMKATLEEQLDTFYYFNEDPTQ